VPTSQTNLRLSSLDRERLDRLAEARGLTQSELVRHLLREADGAPRPEPPDRDELVAILGEQARSGSIRACEILLKRADRETHDAEWAGIVDGMFPRRERAR
jgi:hypothetical protein